MTYNSVINKGETDMENIYNEFRTGSQGFVIAVETYCGFEISRDEIERIAEKAQTADEFCRIWENENWWCDQA